MILCGDNTDLGVSGVRAGVVFPPWKDIRRKEERVGRVKNSYVKISD